MTTARKPFLWTWIWLLATLSVVLAAGRTIPFNPGIPIASQLKAGDTTVRLVNEQMPLRGLLPEDTPPTAVLEYYTDASSAVLDVRIERAISHLSDKADWITTAYDASVLKVLKGKQNAVPGYHSFHRRGWSTSH